MKEKILELSPQNSSNQETIPDDKNEDFLLPRRKKRLSKSETDLTKMANGVSEESLKKPIRKFFFYSFRNTKNKFILIS